MRDYTQLTQEERYQIEALLKMGHHQSEIAVVLKPILTAGWECEHTGSVMWWMYGVVEHPSGETSGANFRSDSAHHRPTSDPYRSS